MIQTSQITVSYLSLSSQKIGSDMAKISNRKPIPKSLRTAETITKSEFHFQDGEEI